MKPLKNSSKFNDIYTPPEPVLDLLPFLKPFEIIWEPAAGEGHISHILQKHHYVYSSDIKNGCNFLTYDAEHLQHDAIVTNPPFSIKNQFLKRCLEQDKPFALLLPITALSHGRQQARHKLYKEHGIEIIFLGYRVHFITPSGKNDCWFDTAWFCRDITGQPMTFL